MATRNQAGVVLSGSTGTGSFVGSTSPTLITPTLGAATATSFTFSPTTDGMIGTTTNDNASSGIVGQISSSIITVTFAINLTNNTSADVTSFALASGDYNVWGNVFFTITGTCTQIAGWTSASSATIPLSALRSLLQKTTGGILNCGFEVPIRRVSTTAGQTTFLSVRALFSTGTVTACGAMYARRIR